MKSDNTGKTIRLSFKTYDRLKRVADTSKTFSNRRLTVEDVINSLLDRYYADIVKAINDLAEEAGDDRN